MAVKIRRPNVFNGQDGKGVDADGDRPGGDRQDALDLQSLRFDEPGPEDFESLGALLVYLRKTYPARASEGRPIGASMFPTARDVARQLDAFGYSMSSGSYSLLEHGKTLPGDPNHFFGALQRALGVAPNSKYAALLRYQYTYDLTARALGAPAADTIVRRGAAALKELKKQRSDR